MQNQNNLGMNVSNNLRLMKLIDIYEYIWGPIERPVEHYRPNLDNNITSTYQEPKQPLVRKRDQVRTSTPDEQYTVINQYNALYMLELYMGTNG